MRKYIIGIFVCCLVCCSCSKIKKTGTEVIVEQTARELADRESTPALKKALSVLKTETREILENALKKDAELLTLFDENPGFVNTWNHLYVQMGEDCMSATVLRRFVHVNDYASYGGNKIENFVFTKLKNGSYRITDKVHPDIELAILKKGGIVEIWGENVNNWFLQLKPLSNCKYRINGAEYEIDELGRVAKAKFKINKNSLQNASHRDNGVNSQMRQLKNSMEGDHAGHLLADEFGGSSNMVNLVPMQGNNVNQSLYAKLENTWKEEALKGKDVQVEIRIQYPFSGEPETIVLGNNTNPLARPEWFEVKYEINGETIIEVIKNE